MQLYKNNNENSDRTGYQAYHKDETVPVLFSIYLFYDVSIERDYLAFFDFGSKNNHKDGVRNLGKCFDYVPGNFDNNEDDNDVDNHEQDCIYVPNHVDDNNATAEADICYL